MAAELGKLTELVRRRDKLSSGIISASSDALLSKEKIPFELGMEEDKSLPEADTLASIAQRLDARGYNEGASFLRGLNKGFNDSGMLTDEMQLELVRKSRYDKSI